jgi:protein O-GlcNAc transferase
MSIDPSGSQQHALQFATGLQKIGKFKEAESAYKDVIRNHPKNVDAVYMLGLLYAQQGKFESAASFFSRAVRIKPDFIDAHYNNGVMLNALGRHAPALACYDRVLARKRDHLGALQNRAGSLFELKRFAEALDGYDLVLAFAGEAADPLDNRGVTLRELGRFEEALRNHDRALALAPDHPIILNNRGVALRALGRCDEALQSYDRAIAIKPDYAEAHHNRGVALLSLKQFEQALESCQRAIQLTPNHLGALQNHGVALLELGCLEEALRSFVRVIELDPKNAEAHSNCGLALCKLKRFGDAMAHFDSAIRLKRDHVEAHNNRGLALNDLERFEEAVESFDRALAIKPDYVEAWHNQGVALIELKRFDEAIRTYDRIATIDPNYGFAAGWRLYTKLRICDWTNLENEVSAVCEKVTLGEKTSHPSALLLAAHSPAVQRKAAEIWRKCKFPESRRLPQLRSLRRRDKIRLGYFSADFHAHATAHLMAGMFELHDRSQFELLAFSFDSHAEDDMRRRLRSTFDDFIDLTCLSDEEAALAARSREIDIAVDLLGFAKGCRPNIFALRAAPIQVNYLGYPGTMSAEYIDYLIADPILIPPAQQSHYSEKIVYLPDCYQPNDRTRSSPQNTPTRVRAGLPESGFVFCCFNNNYKILPEIFDIWARLLNQVEESVLWLIEDNPCAAACLRAEAACRRVDPGRLIFAPYVPLADHLARLQLADLFLDTLPYNAHTTAADALWAGVPIVTRIGETFAGRVAASLLNAVGLPELVTETAQEYEALAVELARNPQQLAAIRNKLAANRLSMPLFDTPRYTRGIEKSYVAMYERHHAGLPADHLYIEAG